MTHQPKTLTLNSLFAIQCKQHILYISAAEHITIAQKRVKNKFLGNSLKIRDAL